MNKKPKLLTHTLILALPLVVMLWSFAPAYAQKKPKEKTKTQSVIPEDKRPKLFLAWIGGSVLAAATIALGMKGSGRTHLD